MIDRLAVLGLVLLFTVALLLPADTYYKGYQLVFYSPLVFFFPPWHANTLFLMGAVSLWFHQRQLAGLCGFAAAVLAVWVIPVKDNQVGLISAYHFWFLACLAMGLVGLGLHSVFAKSKNNQVLK